MFSTVQFSVTNKIANVSLSRPSKKNAINFLMFKELKQIQKQIKKDRQIRAVIISAEGNNFCSGIDVKEVLPSKKLVLKLLWKWLPGNANLAQQIVYGWQTIPVPVIAAIEGVCWGAGLQLALGCDYRICNQNASFAVMESNWGLMPDMAGNLSMHANMQMDKAMMLSMLATEINANAAKANGLVTDLAENPLEAAFLLAEKISARSPDAIAGIKKLYHRLWNPQRRSILAKETFYQWRIVLAKNQLIAVKANKNKKKPMFKNRPHW